MDETRPHTFPSLLESTRMKSAARRAYITMAILHDTLGDQVRMRSGRGCFSRRRWMVKLL